MDNFMSCVPWEQCQNMMGKRMYNRFCKWMNGQTCPIGGVYEHDLETFLEGGRNMD